MSVLSAEIIKERLRRPVSDVESIRITPLLEEKFDRDSVDLRLGCYFRLATITSIECLKPYASDEAEEQYAELIHRPYGREGSTLILQPHHAVLAGTLEYIKMPADASGEILTKSSWARYFVSIASAPWIHPLYRGCLTLEITNLGNVPVALPVGKPIAQLVFVRVEGQAKVKKDMLEGSYAGAVMPEAPVL